MASNGGPYFSHPSNSYLDSLSEEDQYDNNAFGNWAGTEDGQATQAYAFNPQVQQPTLPAPYNGGAPPAPMYQTPAAWRAMTPEVFEHWASKLAGGDVDPNAVFSQIGREGYNVQEFIQHCYALMERSHGAPQNQDSVGTPAHQYQGQPESFSAHPQQDGTWSYEGILAQEMGLGHLAHVTPAYGDPVHGSSAPGLTTQQWGRSYGYGNQDTILVPANAGHAQSRDMAVNANRRAPLNDSPRRDPGNPRSTSQHGGTVGPAPASSFSMHGGLPQYNQTGQSQAYDSTNNGPYDASLLPSQQTPANSQSRGSKQSGAMANASGVKKGRGRPKKANTQANTQQTMSALPDTSSGVQSGATGQAGTAGGAANNSSSGNNPSATSATSAANPLAHVTVTHNQFKWNSIREAFESDTVARKATNLLPGADDYPSFKQTQLAKATVKRLIDAFNLPSSNFHSATDNDAEFIKYATSSYKTAVKKVNKLVTDHGAELIEIQCWMLLDRIVKACEKGLKCTKLSAHFKPDYTLICSQRVSKAITAIKADDRVRLEILTNDTPAMDMLAASPESHIAAKKRFLKSNYTRKLAKLRKEAAEAAEAAQTAQTATQTPATASKGKGKKRGATADTNTTTSSAPPAKKTKRGSTASSDLTKQTKALLRQIDRSDTPATVNSTATGADDVGEESEDIDEESEDDAEPSDGDVAGF